MLLVFVFFFCLFLTAYAELQEVEWIECTQWRHVCVYVEVVANGLVIYTVYNNCNAVCATVLSNNS